MITLERAAELVSKLQKVDRDAAIDLFCTFDDIFQLSNRDDEGRAIIDFAEMCDYGIATNVRILDE